MSETTANVKFQVDQAGQNGSKVQSDVDSDVRQGSQQQGADAAGEEVRRSTEVFAESQREFMEKAMRRFDEVSRKVTDSAQGSTETVRTLLSLPSAAQGGLQDAQQSMTGLIEGVVRTNIRVTQELFSSPTRPPTWSCSSVSRRSISIR